MDSLKLKFTSSNSVPVTEARITLKEFEGVMNLIADLERENKQLRRLVPNNIGFNLGGK